MENEINKNILDVNGPLDESYWLIDGHEDIAWNGMETGRDPITSAYSSRISDAEKGITKLAGSRTLGLPEWIKGRVGIIFSTIFVEPFLGDNFNGRMIYHSPQQANQFGLEQLAYYHALADRDTHFKIIKNRSDLELVVSSHINPSRQPAPTIGLVLLMEGADPILQPEDVTLWAQAGLRMVGLSWAGTRYAGGTRMPGPLTEPGRKLLKRMASSKMILDLSHCAEEAYFEAVDIYDGVIIASHSNPRAFLPTDRGVSDEMILKLVQRDGVVGIVPYLHFLDPQWSDGSPRLSINKVVEAIDYVVQLVGNPCHVALGTDFDGGYGVESIPAEMDSIADVIKIATALEGRGYKKDEITSILHGNWLRILRNGLPES
jgi:membrane dipeptidase